MVGISDSTAGILVLGMHRSGTSALAGTLNLIGVPAVGELLPAESYNEKGLFENKSVNLFHNRLLTELGSRWDDPINVCNSFVETSLGRRMLDELLGILRSELLAHEAVFTVKDPRLCRFLPLWKKAMAEADVEPRAIITLRNPTEVAASLRQRDGFGRAKSFLLWLDHMVAAERETRGLARSFISYDALLANWRKVADQLASELGLTYPIERFRVEAAVDAFLERDLHHHVATTSFDQDSVTTGLELLVARAWSAFLALAKDRDDAAAMAELDAVSSLLDNASSVFAPYIAAESSALLESRERVALLEWTERANAQAAEAADRQHRESLDKARREISGLRSSVEQAMDRAAGLEQRNAGLEADIAGLRMESQAQAAALHAIASSTAWRLTGPFRRIAQAMPSSARWHLRRLAKAGWWAATPWRMPTRLHNLRQRQLNLAHVNSIPSPAVPAPASIRGSVNAPPALGVYLVASETSRISMVTDSINEGSLFGGVATALIFTALLAKRMGRRLRIVTRTQAPAAENVAVVFRAHGIAWAENIEFVFADLADPDNRIDINDDELFVTTSWWTTKATRQSVADRQILYLLQEDERMFYPFGDDQLACAETLNDRAISKVINSGLLHRHLVEEGIVDEETPFFEPAFPEKIYYPSPKMAEDGKHNFFFYARPFNARNLYIRGVAVIDAAIERGILDPALWNIHFVGKDLAPVQLAGGVEPILMQNLAWEDYAAFVRSVDLALTLMYTPHPSYPPLDVAACAGVAVTNRFGVKTDLSGYSRSIVCVDSDVESLVEGLRLGVEQALDPEGRRQALADSGIGRDWAAAFAPVIDRLAESLPHVR